MSSDIPYVGDFAMTNDAPGTCRKCRGTGVWARGAVNGRYANSGKCYTCDGKGYQTADDIKRGNAYNYFKNRRINYGS